MASAANVDRYSAQFPDENAARCFLTMSNMFFASPPCDEPEHSLCQRGRHVGRVATQLMSMTHVRTHDYACEQQREAYCAHTRYSTRMRDEPLGQPSTEGRDYRSERLILSSTICELHERARRPGERSRRSSSGSDRCADWEETRGRSPDP